jgi:insulysin
MDTPDAEDDNTINGSFVTVDSKKTARRLSLKGDVDSSSGQSTPVRDHTKLPQGNRVIGDAVQFKTKMELSPAAVPLIDF